MAIKEIRFSFRKSPQGTWRLKEARHEGASIDVNEAKAIAGIQHILLKMREISADNYAKAASLKNFTVSLQPGENSKDFTLQLVSCSFSNQITAIKIDEIKPEVVRGLLGAAGPSTLMEHMAAHLKAIKAAKTPVGLAVKTCELGGVALRSDQSEVITEKLSWIGKIFLLISLFDAAIELIQKDVNESSNPEIVKSLFSLLLTGLKVAALITNYDLIKTFLMPVDTVMGFYGFGTGLYERSVNIVDGKDPLCISLVDLAEKISSFALMTLTLSALFIGELALAPYIIIVLTTINLAAQTYLYFFQSVD